MFHVILLTTKMFSIFVSIQKYTNALDLLYKPVYKIYIFSFSYLVLFSLVNKYLVTKRTRFSLATYI